jgi:hypothetical protein
MDTRNDRWTRGMIDGHAECSHMVINRAVPSGGCCRLSLLSRQSLVVQRALIRRSPALQGPFTRQQFAEMLWFRYG